MRYILVVLTCVASGFLLVRIGIADFAKHVSDNPDMFVKQSEAIQTVSPLKSPKQPPPITVNMKYY
jgi:hypothetical protein